MHAMHYHRSQSPAYRRVWNDRWLVGAISRWLVVDEWLVNDLMNMAENGQQHQLMQIAATYMWAVIRARDTFPLAVARVARHPSSFSVPARTCTSIVRGGWPRQWRRMQRCWKRTALWKPDEVAGGSDGGRHDGGDTHRSWTCTETVTRTLSHLVCLSS